MEYAGLLGSVALLIWFALRGIDIIFASLVCLLLVIATNDLPPAEGITSFTRVMLESDLPPLLSMFTSVSLVSAITGSASGGLQIFMQTMAPAYLEMGIEPETLHRLATMASGGFAVFSF